MGRWGGGKLAIWLIDKEEVGINETLVDEGLAMFDQDDSGLHKFLVNRGDLDNEKKQLEKEVVQLHQLRGDEAAWR